MGLAALLWLGLFVGAMLIVVCEALGCVAKRVLHPSSVKASEPPKQ
jgi:hypothetical protein